MSLGWGEEPTQQHNKIWRRDCLTHNLKLEYILPSGFKVTIFSSHKQIKGKNHYSKSELTILYSAFFFFFFLAEHTGSLFINQGPNLCSLQWKYRVLTTGPPGKSLFWLLTVGEMRIISVLSQWETKLFIHLCVAQSCSTLCGPMDCGPPGSSVHFS